MLRYFAYTFFLFLTATSSILAQTPPKFDGIYLGLKDGSFVDLVPFSGNVLQLMDLGLGEIPTNGGVQQELIPHNFQGVALQSDILNATFFDSSNLESIFVRSRSLKLQSLEVVTLTKNLPYMNIGSNDQIRQKRIQERLSLEFPSLIGTGCGWNSNSLKVLNESDTTYQYFFEGAGLIDVQGSDIPLSVNSGGGCGSVSIIDGRAFGFILWTNQGRFLILESDLMRDFYLPDSSGNWDSSGLATLNAKIAAADH